MKKIYYEKVGRRYHPISEYDSAFRDSLPRGDHLLSVFPGGASCRYNIDPALAPMIAAGRYAHEAITRRIHESTEMRPAAREIDEETQRRWKEFIATIPEDFRYMFSHGSAYDAAEAGVKAMQEEADKLLARPAVRKAYDHFMLMCKLSGQKDE